jgi:hypothetical protein
MDPLPTPRSAELRTALQSAAAPDGVPFLSRGKHRNPRKGACFMEMASYLAGERWSDHPECTHPLLASVARLVNDYTSDEGRARLAPLIPRVIGLTSDDLRVDATIAMRAATIALPVAAAERQQVLAVSILSAERVLDALGGPANTDLAGASSAALADVPRARKWAQRFTRGLGPSPKGFRRHAAPTTVRCAVQGIARGCVPTPDDYLYQILALTIDDVAAIVNHQDRPAATPSLLTAQTAPQ